MKKLTLLAVLALLSACSPKKSSVKATAMTSATISGFTTSSCTGKTATGTLGKVSDPSASVSTFTARVKDLLTASMQVYNVGSISNIPGDNSRTGVGFKGVLKLDSSGNVVASQTSLTISIYDSIWASNVLYDPTLKEIRIGFSTAAKSTIAGKFDTQTGVGYLSLSDTYGDVRFDGRIDAQNFSGTLTFKNLKNVNAGVAPASGTLGQFQIASCDLLQ